MSDEVTLTGTVEMTVRAEPLEKLVRNYTKALEYMVCEILGEPDVFGRWRYIKRTKRIKWEPDIKEIHYLFYGLLKEDFGLPAKFAIACEREASMVVKSILNNRNNRDRKFTIKSYRARCDNQSYTIRVEGNKCHLRLQGLGWFEVNGFNKKWFEKYREWTYGDLILKLHKGCIKLYVTLKKVVRIHPSKNAIAVDMNFNEVVAGNEKGELRVKTPLQRIMHIKKNHIEKTQKRYNRQWRYVKGIGLAISRWWGRINGITSDFVRQVSRKIVLFAREQGCDTIVLEDLNGLRDKQSKMKKPWRERFTFFAYRKLQSWIEWQGKKMGLAVVFVDPRNTSRTCPSCKSLNTKFEDRTLICRDCGFKVDRDTAAIRNLTNKWLEMWGVRVHPERG